MTAPRFMFDGPNVYVLEQDHVALEAKLEEMNRWQPMVLAPKDATEVLLLVKDRHVIFQMVGHWAHGGGEDQPPFGPAWFYRCGNDFAELSGEMLAWRTLPEAIAARKGVENG